MFSESIKFKFDSTQAHGAKTTDLDTHKIRLMVMASAKRSGRKPPKRIDAGLLNNLGITGTFQGRTAPTIAGHLLYSKKVPQDLRDFSRYFIKCIRFKGITATSPILDKADIYGTLDEQIEGAYTFVLRNMSTRAFIRGTKRIEAYEYPEDAIRELVANAVIHRDYQITETYIQIAIFEDRVEIASPGSLPPTVTEENIREAQVSRNEIIALRLKDLGYLEEYGRGFDIVFDRMEQWGLLSPLLKNTGNQFKVILLGPRVGKLNVRQLILWTYLLENKELTPKKCRELLKGVPRYTILYDLRKLKAARLIEPRGKANNLYYTLKL